MTDTPHLMLYNSLTRKKELFTPRHNPPTPDNPVTMYNCGPTVYSYAHIGNARAAVVADVLYRVLRHIYGEACVKYARNITDVDDKIIAAAARQGVEISDITEKFARIYQEDLRAIGCLNPNVQPKATEHISHMIVMIAELLKKGFAYAADGHVFFDVAKYNEYGQLSGNTLSALKKGDRVGEGEVARKKNAADFVLWKPEAGGVGWDAPFGPDKTNMKGRPGWHIECSAMAKETLGDVIDIHCGGVDLKFPHHENEIAQSCCANGTDNFARFWVHNEFLNMGKDKMSKSLGNVTLIHDLLEKWDGEVIRLALLKAHYRSELNWSEDLLRESKAQLDGWYRGKDAIAPIQEPVHTSLFRVFSEERATTLISWLLNDLRTPSYLASFSDLASYRKQALEELMQYDTNLELQNISKYDLFLIDTAFVSNLNLLGLLQKDPEEWFKGNASGDEAATFDAIALRRQEARAAKDWAAADAARDEASALGIVLEDGPDGTRWRKA